MLRDRIMHWEKKASNIDTQRRWTLQSNVLSIHLCKFFHFNQRSIHRGFFRLHTCIENHATFYGREHAKIFYAVINALAYLVVYGNDLATDGSSLVISPHSQLKQWRQILDPLNDRYREREKERRRKKSQPMQKECLISLRNNIAWNVNKIGSAWQQMFNKLLFSIEIHSRTNTLCCCCCWCCCVSTISNRVFLLLVGFIGFDFITVVFCYIAQHRVWRI